MSEEITSCKIDSSSLLVTHISEASPHLCMLRERKRRHPAVCGGKHGGAVTDQPRCQRFPLLLYSTSQRQRRRWNTLLMFPKITSESNILRLVVWLVRLGSPLFFDDEKTETTRRPSGMLRGRKRTIGSLRQAHDSA